MDTAQHTAPLAFHFFGTPKILVGEREARVALKRGVALLAYLAHAPGPAPRSHLAALLWPDIDDSTARSRLRRLLYNLELSLGRGRFEALGDTLALKTEGVSVDTLEFARLARAQIGGDAGREQPTATLETWVERACEPVLHGLDVESHAFDDWVRAQRIDHDHLLARLLGHLIERHRAAGNLPAAIRAAERLLGLDQYSEPAYVTLMRLHAAQGNAAGVEATFMRCADALRGEFGSKPGALTERAYLDIVEGLRQAPMQHTTAPDALRVQFAESGAGTVAYARLGQAPRAIVIIPGFISHIEIGWEQPQIRRFLLSLAQRFTVFVFDRRGVGLSERLDAPCTAEAAANDVCTLLDHAGIRKAWLFGSSEGGPIALRLAADHASRVEGLLLFGAMARGCWAVDHPWALPREAFDVWADRLVANWGGPANIDTFAPSVQDDPAMRSWWARMLRHAVSPASLRVTLRALRDVDVRHLLPRIAMPTLVMHRRDDRAVRFGAGEHLAGQVPGARFLPLAGVDHWWWCGDTDAVLGAMSQFVDEHSPVT